MLLLLVYTLFPARAQTTRLTGSVHPGSPPIEILVHNQIGEEEFAKIDRVDIRSRGHLLQTISFNGDEVPTVRLSGETVRLIDIDCDGYKDLLVQHSVGIHGDAWYHLFRFNPAENKFVAYRRFSELPFVSVDCGKKVVTTYVNSGAAGCFYESGIYRWEKGELVPVRMETQVASEENDGTFTRTIRTLRNGNR